MLGTEDGSFSVSLKDLHLFFIKELTTRNVNTKKYTQPVTNKIDNMPKSAIREPPPNRITAYLDCE